MRRLRVCGDFVREPENIPEDTCGSEDHRCGGYTPANPTLHATGLPPACGAVYDCRLIGGMLRLKTLQAFETKGLFGHMTPDQRTQVYELMTPRTISPGTELMKQGDNGDTYFVIESGTADVYVHGPDEVGTQLQAPSANETTVRRTDKPRADVAERSRQRGGTARVGRVRRYAN